MTIAALTVAGLAVVCCLLALLIACNSVRHLREASEQVEELEDALARHQAALNLMSEALLGSGEVDWDELVENYLLAIGEDELAVLDAQTEWEWQ